MEVACIREVYSLVVPTLDQDPLLRDIWDLMVEGEELEPFLRRSKCKGRFKECREIRIFIRESLKAAILNFKTSQY